MLFPAVTEIRFTVIQLVYVLPDCWKYLHKTLNTAPWIAFVNRRVWSPRPNKPLMPSVAIMSFTISEYDRSLALSPSDPSSAFPSRAVCFVVFITRRLLEHTSETQDADSPKNAERANDTNKSSDAATIGS